MKSREISRSKNGPFSLACTDPYIGIGWEYQSTGHSGMLNHLRPRVYTLTVPLIYSVYLYAAFYRVK